MLQMCCEMKRCASFKKRLTSSMSSKITRIPSLEARRIAANIAKLPELQRHG
jgi:hypothetical protein